MKAAEESGEDFCDPARKETIFGKEKYTTGAVGRAPQRPNHCLGQSVEVLGESLVHAVVRAPRLRKRMWERPFWDASVLAWTRGIVCSCAQRPPTGTFQGSMGRMASSKKELVLCLCGNAQGVRADWFTPFGSRR